MNKKKTYKRELAIALFIPLFFSVYQSDVEMAKVLVWPTFTFAGLAFGLDWHGKQLRKDPFESSDGEWPQRSSEYPSGKNEYTNSRDY